MASPMHMVDAETPLTWEVKHSNVEDAEPEDGGQCRRAEHGVEPDGDPAAMSSDGAHHGEELGMDEAVVGDDAEKDGENIGISRIGIDPVL
jgi:hypothetical protein